jgi:hypothetical protein
LAQPTGTEWPSEPRTLLKHQIYKRYVDCWMGKILQRLPSASIVDAIPRHHPRATTADRRSHGAQTERAARWHTSPQAGGLPTQMS